MCGKRPGATPPAPSCMLVRQALRQDWPIPPDVKSQILQRLIDYLDREHDEGATASDRQVVSAAKTVCEFMKLNVEQAKIDLAREKLAGGDGEKPLASLLKAAADYSATHDPGTAA